MPDLWGLRGRWRRQTGQGKALPTYWHQVRVQARDDRALPDVEPEQVAAGGRRFRQDGRLACKTAAGRPYPYRVVAGPAATLARLQPPLDAHREAVLAARRAATARPPTWG